MSSIGSIGLKYKTIVLKSNYLCPFRFYDKRDAEDALDSMDGRLLDGRELRVQMARYGRPSSPYRRGRRRRLVLCTNTIGFFLCVLIVKIKK